MAHQLQLLQLLADGRFHSGERLGEALGVGRGAVWKALHSLSDLGIEVHALQGKGYRLAQPLELLEEGAIRDALPVEVRALLSRLEIHPEIDSTNRYLVTRAAEGARSGYACLAERQSAGRGRRGRRWVSPFGANLYLSLLWRFERDPASLGTLSLAAGVAVARALERLGVARLGLKWPNDVVVEGRKLGGLLLELAGEAAGPSRVVVGVGINVRMPDAAARQIDQPWADLQGELGTGTPSRNRIAALVLAELLPAMAAFARSGFAPFRSDWARWDVVTGRTVTLHLPDRELPGRALAVDATGALVLEDDSGVRQAYSSGEVSLRRVL